jgi:hypothetical protein
MTKSVEIPGGYAILRDRDELRGRDRNLIRAAAMAAAGAIAKMPETVQEGAKEGETDEETAKRLEGEIGTLDLTWQESLSLLELRQATMIACLESWTLPQPLPTMDTVGDLPAELYDALDAAIGGVTTAISAATDFDENPDHDSPTGSSTSSDAPLGVPEAESL